MGEHECVFVEEQEPSGRLILPPCLVCGATAMDALAQLRDEPLVAWAVADDALRCASAPSVADLFPGIAEMCRDARGELRRALRRPW